MRVPPLPLETPRSGNSDSHDRSTYGCTLAISQTSDDLNSARLGISMSATNRAVCCKLRQYNTFDGVWQSKKVLSPKSLRVQRVPESSKFSELGVEESSMSTTLSTPLDSLDSLDSSDSSDSSDSCSVLP